MKTSLILLLSFVILSVQAQELNIPLGEDLCIRHQVYEGTNGDVLTCTLFKNTSNVFSFRLIQCDSLLRIKHDSLLYFNGAPNSIYHGISRDKQNFYFFAINYNHSATTVAIDLSNFEIKSAYNVLSNNFDFNFSSNQLFQIDSKFFLFGFTKEIPSILQLDAETTKQYEIYPHAIRANSLLKNISLSSDSTLKLVYTTLPQNEASECMYWELDSHRNSIFEGLLKNQGKKSIPTQIERLPNSTLYTALTSLDGESIYEMEVYSASKTQYDLIQSIDLLNDPIVSHFLTKSELKTIQNSKKKKTPPSSNLLVKQSHVYESDSSYIIALELYRESSRVESHYGNSEHKYTYLVSDGKEYLAILFVEINKSTFAHTLTAIPIRVLPKPTDSNTLIHYSEKNSKPVIRVLSTSGIFDFTFDHHIVRINNNFAVKLPELPYNEFIDLPCARGFSTNTFLFSQIKTVRGADKYLVNNLNSFINVFQFALPPFP